VSARAEGAGSAGRGLYLKPAKSWSPRELLYLNPAGNCRLQAPGRKVGIANSALMAVGALLRVKIFGRHAEHVVTLYANAVQSRLSRRRSFLFWGMSL
jgi:hypothetical protein